MAGGEAGITSVASNAVGVLGFLAGEAVVPSGGGIIGYGVGSFGTSIYLDGKFWVDYNHTYFGAAGY